MSSAASQRQPRAVGIAAMFESMTELGKTNALNLMEEEGRSRPGRETLNLQLRESEERYRTLFDLGPVAVYSIDTLGVIQNFNRRAAELWGRAPAAGDTDERFCGSYKVFRPGGRFLPPAEGPIAGGVSWKERGGQGGGRPVWAPARGGGGGVVGMRRPENARGEYR